MYVLDTNVVSHLRRPDKAHSNVIAWASSTPVTLHFISSSTLHEIERGILSMEHKDAAQGAILRAWMNPPGGGQSDVHRNQAKRTTPTIMRMNASATTRVPRTPRC